MRMMEKKLKEKSLQIEQRCAMLAVDPCLELNKYKKNEFVGKCFQFFSGDEQKKMSEEITEKFIKMFLTNSFFVLHYLGSNWGREMEQKSYNWRGGRESEFSSLCSLLLTSLCCLGNGRFWQSKIKDQFS